MKRIQIIKNVLTLFLWFASVLFLSCSMVSEDKGYHIYEFTGRHDFLEDFFTLNLQPVSQGIDRFHGLNPDVFVPTNLAEPVWDRANKKYCIKSPDTGKVYECKVEKGTKIRTNPIRN